MASSHAAALSSARGAGTPSAFLADPLRRSSINRVNRDGRVARAERLREERRTQILGACRRVFARRGYHSSSIQEILDEAGIARGTFYAHFDSKQAALEEILTEFLEGLPGD